MKKILIIDDNETFRTTLADYLPKEKYEVITASNGEEGLEKKEQEKPDLIILDIMMPKMGGLEFLNKINKKESQELPVPIIIASQMSEMSEISEGVALGLKAGVKGYIIKSEQSLSMIAETISKILDN